MIEVNNTIRSALETGMKTEQINEAWDFLQVQCAMFIDSDLPGVTSQQHVMPGKPVK